MLPSRKLGNNRIQGNDLKLGQVMGLSWLAQVKSATSRFGHCLATHPRAFGELIHQPVRRKMKQLSQVVAAGVPVLAVFSVTSQFNLSSKGAVTDAARTPRAGVQALPITESAAAAQSMPALEARAEPGQ